jgi:hypothetical protein
MFIAHQFLFDRVIFPRLRCYLPETRNYDSTWFAPAAETLVYKWQGTVEEATTPDETSGELNLSPRCKASIARAEAWSVGREVEEVFPVTGSFVTVHET